MLILTAHDGQEDRVEGFDEEVTSNLLEVMVNRLRRKLDDSGTSVQIHKVRGVGWYWMEFPP